MARLTRLPNQLNELPHRLGIAPTDQRGRDAERRKRQPWRKWYYTKEWRDLRLEVLSDAGWVCEQTGVLLSGKPHAPNSPVIDHITPHRGVRSLFFDRSNLQAVSKNWHDSEKQRLEKSGLA